MGHGLGWARAHWPRVFSALALFGSQHLPHQYTALAESRSVSVDTAASALRQVALDFAPRASVPYSQVPRAVAVLLSDGTVVPGVRVESASYSLVIPAVVNAVSTCFALGHRDLVAVAASDALLERETRYLDGYLDSATTIDGVMRVSGVATCPKPGAVINPVEPGAAGTALYWREALLNARTFLSQISR